MNTCVPNELDLFSIRRRLIEADIFKQLQGRSEQDAKEALVEEFGAEMAAYIEAEYPQLYQAYVEMVLHQVPWTTGVVSSPHFFS